MSQVHRTPSSNFDDIPFHTAHPVRVLHWDAPDIDGGSSCTSSTRPRPATSWARSCCCTASRRGACSTSSGSPASRRPATAASHPISPASVAATSPPTTTGTRTSGTSPQCATSSTRSTSTDIHLVVQDWAGPIGLRQAVDQPERFAPAVHLQHLAAPRRVPLRRRRPLVASGRDRPGSSSVATCPPAASSPGPCAVTTTTVQRSRPSSMHPFDGPPARPVRVPSRPAPVRASPRWVALPNSNAATRRCCRGRTVPCTSPSATPTRCSRTSGRSVGRPASRRHHRPHRGGRPLRAVRRPRRLPVDHRHHIGAGL